MAITSGTDLLHYRLVEKIGQGGMGAVWRATDTTLGRDVAIKVLPEAFAADPERLARFEREAKLLASLNHPNIAGIYGLHESAGARFLAMELVPGEDLAERLTGGPVPAAESMRIAAQLAEALEAAHEQGVVHRDLKPANVKITPDGKVKVLDFGLAKALETAASLGSGRDPAASPTITSLGTMVGVVLGTAAYMSPEQARGKGVDKRADIWAFGCVLYEMLTGRRPFDGETISDTLASVLARDPDWSALPAATPAKVRELMQRCLEKDPKRRLRDIGDARIELDETLAAGTASGRVRVAAPPEGSTVPEAAGRSVSRGVLGGMVLAGVLAGLLAGWYAARRDAPGADTGVVRLDLDFPSSVRFTDFAVSPDGSAIAAVGAPRVAPGESEPPPRIYLRRLDSGTMTVVPGTEGSEGFRFSTDGRFLFTATPATLGSSQRNLVRVPVDGSAPPLKLTAWDPHWTAGSVLAGGGLLALHDGTGLVRIADRPGEPAAPVPIDLAGERGVITLASTGLPGNNGVLLHAIAYGAKGWYYRVGVLDLRSARVSYLFDDGGNPVYSPTGNIVFTRGDALLAVPFDASAMKVTGAPVPIASGLRTDYSFLPANFGLSSNGVLVYVAGGRAAEGRRLGLVDSAGKLTAVSEERRPYQRVQAGSADGRRFVATITNGQGIDELWTGEFDRPGLRRILSIPAADIFTPVLSRDGRTVVFGRRGHTAEDGIYAKSLDDATPPRRIARLRADDVQTNLWSFLPDGSGVVGRHAGPDQKGDIVLVPVPPSGESSAEPTPIVTGPSDESGGAVSPDGRWISYTSDETGRNEIYVSAFAPGGTVGERVQVTKSGGADPFWSADGRSIRFKDPSGRIESMTVASAPALSVGAPAVLYDAGNLNVIPGNVLPDGRQLVMIRGEGEADEIRRCSVVLNFSKELVEKMTAAR